MKSITLSFVFILIFSFSFNAYAQVKIGDNAKTINANSLLELESTTKGLLLPRLTGDQIKAMSNVPVGMFVFNSTDSSLYLRRDTGWAVLAFATSTSSVSQWTNNGNNINNTNSGNVGIGTATPAYKLDVAGNVRATGIIVPALGSSNNFITTNTGGNFITRTGFGGLGLNYIICVSGLFPSRSGLGSEISAMIGEVKLFAGNFAPDGWAFCDGSLLSISSNTPLFSILGTTYGGDGRTNFALPDLRNAVAVGVGSVWQLGEKN